MAVFAYEFAAVKTPAGLVFQCRSEFDRVVSVLGDGEQVWIRLSKEHGRRTIQQNRALWGRIYDQLLAGIAESVGYDAHDKAGKEHMHEGLLMLFGGTVVDPVTKREVARERSSTMTVQRFGEFLEWIARYAASEHGVVVTLPGEL